MKFVDSCDLDVVAGKGGNGAIAFRREKFVPFGGPSGGDGGRGGDVVLIADEGLSTLLDLAHVRTLRAESGENGQGKDCYGRAGRERVVRVPVGTQVFERATGELLFDIDAPGARIVVARGGKGGRGNIHFATPYDRAPRRAEPGGDGEERALRLELKVMADVGLLGFPNVGKSTFIRACSGARPKVADYPFTTLTPSLGVVRVGDEASFVIADIPGLVPGAAEGHGLGLRFLKHVERCRALLHLITLDPGEDRDPVADYDALRRELSAFDPALAERPEIVALSKADLPEVREAHARVREALRGRGVDVRLVSAATGEGLRELTVALYKLVTGKSEVESWELASPSPRATEEAPTDDDAPPASSGRDAPTPNAPRRSRREPSTRAAVSKVTRSRRASVTTSAEPKTKHTGATLDEATPRKAKASGALETKRPSAQDHTTPRKAKTSTSLAAKRPTARQEGTTARKAAVATPLKAKRAASREKGKSTKKATATSPKTKRAKTKRARSRPSGEANPRKASRPSAPTTKRPTSRQGNKSSPRKTSTSPSREAPKARSRRPKSKGRVSKKA